MPHIILTKKKSSNRKKTSKWFIFPFFFLGYFYLDRLCYSKCPENYFGTLSEVCSLSCENSQYKDVDQRLCKSCDISCLTCSGPSESDCLSCSESLYHEKGGKEAGKCSAVCPSPLFSSHLTNFCVDTCPLNYWGNIETKKCENSCLSISTFKNYQTKICEPCHSSCLTCEGASNCQCLSCPKGLYFLDNECVSDCGPQKFGNSSDNTCQPCASPCLLCSTPDGPGLCTACGSSLFLNNNECLSQCETNKSRMKQIENALPVIKPV